MVGCAAFGSPMRNCDLPGGSGLRKCGTGWMSGRSAGCNRSVTEAAELAVYSLARCAACQRIVNRRHLGAKGVCTDRLDCILGRQLAWLAEWERRGYSTSQEVTDDD